VTSVSIRLESEVGNYYERLEVNAMGLFCFEVG